MERTASVNSRNVTDVATPSDREIVITRRFDAPRALVYKVWTNPEHVGKWWGPQGFTTTTNEMDVRPGGVWRFIMHGPDGVDYPNRIEYVEVVEPERLHFLHGGDDEDGAEPFRVTVTFTEYEGQTEVTMRQVYASAEDRQKSVDFGAIEGGNQTLDRLGAYLATM